jgi:predicted small secreted protein
MNKKTILLTALFILTALLLTACKINVITDIQSDGSGAYIQEFGMTTEDLSGLGMDAESFCDEMGNDMPPGMSARQETRDKETWCIFETKFASLDELQKLYGETDTRINQIVIADGELIYDVTLDMSGESNAVPGMGLNANWIVKMPGKVTESTATEQNGSTLTWKLALGKENNLRAVSKVGGAGLDLGGDWVWYLLGSGVFLCLCCFVPLVIGGGAGFYFWRKKQTAAPVTDN